MAFRSNDSSATRIPTLDPRIHFLTQAVPLRAELERAALRYTHNFHDAEDLVSETTSARGSAIPPSHRGLTFEPEYTGSWSTHGSKGTAELGPGPTRL